MTNQEIFDKVAVSLLRQGKKSQDQRGTCLYRSHDVMGNVLKCGVGHLIPDRAYDASYEYRSFTVLIGEHPELLKIIDISRGQLGLVTLLQLVHDDAYPLDGYAELEGAHPGALNGRLRGRWQTLDAAGCRIVA